MNSSISLCHMNPEGCTALWQSPDHHHPALDRVSSHGICLIPRCFLGISIFTSKGLFHFEPLCTASSPYFRITIRCPKQSA